MWLLHFMTSHQYLSIVTVYADPEQWSDDFKRGGRMRCLICKQGETRPQQATVPLQRQETTIIFKGVPADVCDNCGEYYLSENITERLLERAEEAVKNGSELEIVRFAA